MSFQTCKFHLHILRYFWWNPRAFWPSIDSKGTTMVKAQNRSKDIVKTVHVTSVAQHELFLFFAQKKYSCNFIKLRLNHWCHIDYFNDVLATFQYGAREGPSLVHLVLSWPRYINLWERHINSWERDNMLWPQDVMLRERHIFLVGHEFNA